MESNSSDYLNNSLILCFCRWQYADKIFYDYIAICFLAFRLLLSFSRTGVVALVVSLGAILFCLIMNNSIKLKKILIYLSIIVMAGIVVWNKVDDVTHGVASFRFSGRIRINCMPYPKSCNRL